MSRREKREMAQEILDRTSRCRSDFACLEHNGKEYPKCDVKLDVTKRIIVVYSQRERCDGCGYCLTFGISEKSFLCQCPTRIALFYRYEI
jgi:hypothetical protein